ncbi:MAG: 3-hydroxybutyryl-CoA dehydratase [Clostridiales bacterium]|jgi:3-hydroxybutyryl-CoA dehydratase|uniref:MaoC family dehydratase n=1 Tax=Fusibacter paucivorans TaxID=76009 RepID=A0ABS5PQH7_9FIRM|nr:MaoC family dehydratase [Fusibacter paucivorans]MBS7527414.1 MaoC family dehydratase [Fusibacter paucivorans]MDK2868099.1 3-hydroxybutyryl-CoA dehydratase [Clostridiales bacterium]MDN5299414.1 3-hydroxybutyryl-CoA dehydratase [Clostridiales bacterium]
MIGKSIDELKVGDKASFTKTITETDVYLYAGISGDLNPAHINQVESEKTMFKGRIAHGMLTASFISTVLGCYLPGPGTIYLGQTLKFKKPVRFGDTITAVAEVISADQEKNRVILKTTCYNQNDEVVIEGEATAMPPKKA